MLSLDFSKIRNHDGSQDNGFEELVCQLAHLSPPDGAKSFVRKDGGGGDAGVECYWKLDDGSEHAWQAKYFIDSLGASQWSQISKSVETALKKHPEITKYYVCLPRDWNDSRKKGKGGDDVKSAWDMWLGYVAKWEEIAKDLNKKVEFTYWCKHEISLLLQRDTAEFSGRARYWFNSPILTTESFTKLTERSKHSLGERYTPEFHLELPIASIFEALGNTNVWWKKLKSQIDDWRKTASNAREALQVAADETSKTALGQINTEVDDLSRALLSDYSDKSFVEKINKYVLRFNSLLPGLSEVSRILSQKRNDDKESENRRILLNSSRKIESETIAFFNYLSGRTGQAVAKRSILLIGDAGMGKSHLLCDIAVKRLEDDLPTVFLLGQHYLGGNPLKTFKDSLDMNDVSYSEFLGTLDAVGEAKKTKALIIVDAINEGTYRDDWENHLGGMLTDILKFPHLCVALSCRTTYVDYLVNEKFIDNPLVKVTHPGFKGFEHRAAEKYLSLQGISKPGSPITAPEFTNPLFLKVCCRALRDRGLSSFPKGLNGITKIFDFYVESVEYVVRKKKRYRPGEDVVKQSLESFSEALFPDHLFGIPISEAREIINNSDPKQNQRDDLFDILIQEGVLSEDLDYDEKMEIRNRPVVRFTYERFSDHFIATNLSQNLDEDSLKHMFEAEGILSSIGENGFYDNYIGLLGALSIIIAEKWGQELVDLLPEGKPADFGFSERLLLDTLQWRVGESFTERTRELLNELRPYGSGFRSHSIDILFQLATEPGHPWNADFLHKNLAKMSMPTRDRFWSTHITISDYSEVDAEEDSILRSHIEWAYSGAMEQVEPERIRLCAMALLWLTSASNRRTRDQATKSVMRILSLYPGQLSHILKLFYNVNDLYVLERLYAVAYGVVCNVEDENCIKDTAKFVWENIFSESKPVPHILIRDYASGVMELAYKKGLTESHIEPKVFRPPYTSDWPLQDTSEQELGKITGEKYSSSIRNSIMGFPGDFGNYTMGCVHRWSPTPIAEPQAQTVHELQCEFANGLREDLRERMLVHLKTQKEIDDQPFNPEGNSKKIKELTEGAKATQNQEKEKVPTEYGKLISKIESALSSDGKEGLRWVMGLGRPSMIGAFSRKKAHRWVCKRAFELGWTVELFEKFEDRHTISEGRHKSVIERIGKKYQWIALYEFLAHLSDNCHYIDPGYNDVDYSKYFGPWQIYKRNLDPTCWLRKTHDEGNRTEKEYWWQPFVYSFYGETLEELEDWLWNQQHIPPFESLLQVENPTDRTIWLVIKGFANWEKEPVDENEGLPHQDGWYRINSCIVHKNDVTLLEKSLKDSNFRDPDFLPASSTGHQGFLREYPWHPVYKDMENWKSELGYPNEIEIRHLVPTAVYEWESGSSDHSLDESLSIFLPASEIIKSLNLSPDLSNFNRWQNEANQTIFFDPGVEMEGPSCALIRSDVFLEWLERNDCQLVWMIGGEKELLSRGGIGFYGRLEYNGMYKYENGQISGNIWFNELKPDGED